MTAKITKIKIDGLRTLSNFELELGKLTVLIGENGCGKSSVVEAFELLRRAPMHSFVSDFNHIHGGESLLLRSGESVCRIKVAFVDGSLTGIYEVAVNSRGISQEIVAVVNTADATAGAHLISRVGDQAVHYAWKNGLSLTTPESLEQQLQAASNEGTTGGLAPQHSLLSIRGNEALNVLLDRTYNALSNIDVHLNFDTLALWGVKSVGSRSLMREGETLSLTHTVERFGANLANVYFRLKNESSRDEWDYTMELVRAGLGEWVESVVTRADAGPGRIVLMLKRVGIDKPIYSAALSDGQLAYLAFVALARLPSQRSILVFDEVDLHLHPSMLTNVMSLLQQISEKCPVLITTHSRRLLDELDDPADSVRVMELEPSELKTVVSRLDKEVLKDWLEDYNGVGDVFDSGYPEALLMQRPKME